MDAFANSPCVSVAEEVVLPASPTPTPLFGWKSQSGCQQLDSGSPVNSRCVKRSSNERERWRHHNVNDAFKCLSTLLPIFPIHKKLKKKEILDRSIKYIAMLQSLLRTMEDTGNTIRPNNIKPNGVMEDNDIHPITLISSSLSASLPTSISSSDDVFSDDGSDYRSNSPISAITQPRDGADDWLADMLDTGYFY